MRDERLHRFDIRVDPTTEQLKPDTPLALKLRVMRLSEGGCRPLAGAQVDIWQCAAVDVHSEVPSASVARMSDLQELETALERLPDARQPGLRLISPP